MSHFTTTTCLPDRCTPAAGDGRRSTVWCAESSAGVSAALAAGRRDVAAVLADRERHGVEGGVEISPVDCSDLGELDLQGLEHVRCRTARCSARSDGRAVLEEGDLG